MRKSLGDQELQVLDFVLERGPVSAREAGEHFAEAAGLARSTVQTVMERLRKKGFLKRREQDGIFVYEAALERRTLLNEMIGEFIKNRLSGSVTPLVAYLSESRKLKPEELEQLREIVRRQESEQ